MHPEVEELRPKLKEILYDCAVELRATKAALYLLDPSIRRFELVAEYGFRNSIRQSADYNDPLVDRCGRGRSAFFVNGLTAEPRLSELLFEASTERMLAVPLFSRGNLVGIIDMRDKAAKAPFENSDLPKAQAIGERLLAVFNSKNVFGQRFITLSDAEPLPATVALAPSAPQSAPAPPPPSRPAPLEAPPLAPPRAATAPLPTGTVVARPPVEPSRRPTIVSLVAEARSATGRVMMPAHPAVIGDNELDAAREVLRAVLLLPGAVAVAFSATGASGAVEEVVSRGTMTEEALNALDSKLQTWLSKRGQAAGVMHKALHTPLGLVMPPITASQLHKVFTAPVNAGDIHGVYLTVAFSQPPERQTHELLASLLNQLQSVIDFSLTRTALQKTRLTIAQKLLEPEFTRYPELRRHSEAATAACEVFGRYLGLPAEEAELLKLTALVHDVGMRLLDYDRLYAKRGVTEDEVAMLREHVSIGAAMVEPLLGVEVARGVLCHHERVDGTGYPNSISGEDIPQVSRILQICDAYVAMVGPETYQIVESPDDALAAITRGAGTQFDPQLAARFVEMVSQSPLPSTR